MTRNADRDRSEPGDPEADRKALRKLHQTIRKVTEDFNNRWHFNTSIAALMELVNMLYEEEARLSRAALDQILPALTLLLGPFAPYIAEELWEQLGRTGPVFRQPWPAYDEELAKEDAAEIVLQVNGKLRGRILGAVRNAEGGAGARGSGRSEHAALPRRQAGGESDRGAG